MGKPTDDQVKAMWQAVRHKANFGEGGHRSWRCPIYPSLSYKEHDFSKPTPPEEMYVEFRLERVGYGVYGGMGHRVTRVIGNGVVVEETHHEDQPVFITPKEPARPEG